MLFGPLACLEVQSSRIEGNVVVLSVRLNINLNAEPIEKVVAQTTPLHDRSMTVTRAGKIRIEPTPYPGSLASPRSKRRSAAASSEAETAEKSPAVSWQRAESRSGVSLTSHDRTWPLHGRYVNVT